MARASNLTADLLYGEVQRIRTFLNQTGSAFRIDPAFLSWYDGFAQCDHVRALWATAIFQ